MRLKLIVYFLSLVAGIFSQNCSFEITEPRTMHGVCHKLAASDMWGCVSEGIMEPLNHNCKELNTRLNTSSNYRISPNRDN
jgi:hypothetical protein